jgi:hypothetical protein
MRLLALVGVLLLGSYTCELCSDRLSHFRPDAGDTLDPVGRSRELVKRGDVVPLQNSPGLQGQTQTWNGTFTNSPGVTGHLPRLLPSGCRAASPAQMASSAGDTFLGDLFHRCGMIPDVEQADGAAPPPSEGAPGSPGNHPAFVLRHSRADVNGEPVGLREERNALALRLLHLDLAQFGDDLLRAEPLLRYRGLLGSRSILLINLVQFHPVRSRRLLRGM